MGFAAFGQSGHQVVTVVTDRNNLVSDVDDATTEDFEEKDGDPAAIRTRDPQLRRLFRESCNLLELLRYSENLVRSSSAIRCQEVP